jgi:hypothetical protein
VPLSIGRLRRAVLLGERAGLLRDAAVLGEGHIELSIIPAGREDKQPGEPGEDGQQHVEDAEPDEAGRHAEVVAAVRQAPGQRVQHPQERHPRAEHEVVALDADAVRALETLAHDADEQEEKSQRAEAEEAPLVLGGGRGRDGVADHPDGGEGGVEDDGRPRHAADHAEGQDGVAELDDPEEVLGPEDLAGETGAVELVRLGDGVEEEVRGLGEVGDGADQGGDGKEIVEELFAVAGAELQHKEDQLGRELVRKGWIG